MEFTENARFENLDSEDMRIYHSALKKAGYTRTENSFWFETWSNGEIEIELERA